MNSFGSRSILRVGKREFEIYRLDALEKQGCAVAHLPFSLRILLENLLRREDGKAVKADDIRALASWNGKSFRRRKSRSCRVACCCRISREFRRWSISPPCAMP